MALKAQHSKTISIDAGSITVKTGNILKSLQVPPDKADKYLLDQIELYRKKCIELSKPCATYTLHENPHFVTETGELLVNNITFSLGKIVTQSLRKSTSVAFFICTCGESLPQLSKQLMSEGHTLEGYIVDLVGSEIAESLAERIHLEIGRDMKKTGLKTTNRYSPGYCNWPVSDQQALFSMMENFCGVSLTPSSLMMPIKSVSGIVGIGTDVKNRGYSCSKCDAAFCIYRDKR